MRYPVTINSSLFTKKGGAISKLFSQTAATKGEVCFANSYASREAACAPTLQPPPPASGLRASFATPQTWAPSSHKTRASSPTFLRLPETYGFLYSAPGFNTPPQILFARKLVCRKLVCALAAGRPILFFPVYIFHCIWTYLKTFSTKCYFFIYSFHCQCPCRFFTFIYIY